MFYTLSLLLLCVWCTLAYIPAGPTNDTDAIDLGDAAHIKMVYKPSVSYNDILSFVLAQPDSSGVVQGALVHFTEEKLTDDTTTTPWIACVSCDANSTGFSTDVDIFTLAKNRGATGVLLYSQAAEACLMNTVYLNFVPALDVFMPESKAETQKLLMQFDNLPNASYAVYNPLLLNQSSATVEHTMLSGNATTSNFIVATLKAPDRFFANDTDTNSTNSDQDPPSHPGNPSTGLAMIVLYAITGCVSTLFIVVILSGAIRTIRHPERYGPRAAGVNGRGLPISGQSRTGGLGRAILDTFPIVKFGQTQQTDTPTPIKDDIEHSAMELSVRPPSGSDTEEKTVEQGIAKEQDLNTKDVTPSSFSPVQQEGQVHNNPAGKTSPDPEPSAMGHETCPICIVDFAEGDNVRVLPCDGKHQFHQACVDPWLLELSSSCPICREDFHALETMLSGDEGREENSNEQIGRTHRFTRYLRFARRHRHMVAQREPPSEEGSGENTAS